MTLIVQPDLPAGVVRIGLDASLPLPGVVLMFCCLDQARAKQPGQKEKFGCAVFLPAGYDLSPLKAICKAKVVEKWSDNPDRWPDDMRQPFKAAEKCIDPKTGKMYEGLTAGGWLINVSSERPPGLVRLDNSRIANPKVELYAGVYALVTVNAYTYGGPGTGFRAGVNLGLRSIQKQREGTPLGGAVAMPESEFAPSALPAKPGETAPGKPVSARDLFS